jgi:hypothetical protein
MLNLWQLSLIIICVQIYYIFFFFALLRSGIQDILIWSVGTFTAVGTFGWFLHSANPIVFMDLVHWLICFTMAYISTPATIWLLPWILFGRFLVGMISSHEDVPAICAASCK